MVNDEGQLYTIEGVAAAVLLVVTAYLVLNATSLFTPGDTHINDMQLEQLGTDVLRMMDTTVSFNSSSNSSYYQKMSPLEFYIITNNSSAFKNDFYSYAQENDTSLPPLYKPPLHMDATIYYSNGSNMSYLSPTSPMTNRENIVTVTRWVNLRDQVVLFEVHLWRN
jgi:hypothetical protein